MSADVTEDWFWEGNVVDSLAAHLRTTGWQVHQVADTHSKEQGVDIVASRDGNELLVEVKGYPSTQYRDPRRASEKKPTNPTNQAQQWFSHALLKALRLQGKHSSSTVALAFPDFPRYRTLAAETSGGLKRLGILVYFCREDGEVIEFLAGQ